MYYECKNITGMKMENGGRFEPNGFHWEMSVLKNELMTA